MMKILPYIEQHQQIPISGQMGIYTAPWESGWMGKTQWPKKKNTKKTHQNPTNQPTNQI